jgi:hypothetical protein
MRAAHTSESASQAPAKAAVVVKNVTAIRF